MISAQQIAWMNRICPACIHSTLGGQSARELLLHTYLQREGGEDRTLLILAWHRGVNAQDWIVHRRRRRRKISRKICLLKANRKLLRRTSRLHASRLFFLIQALASVLTMRMRMFSSRMTELPLNTTAHGSRRYCFKATWSEARTPGDSE